MKLPKDRGAWHDGHLDAAIRERNNAFARYERALGTAAPEVSDQLYAEYQRKDKVVSDVANVVGRRAG